MVMNKYQEILTLLNNIESRYGSIVNCPEDDPDYLRIREFYPSTGHGSSIDDFEDRIYKLAHEGYTASEIVRLVNGNDGDIYNFIKRHRVRLKKVFKYQITTPSGEKYYVTNLVQFIKSYFKYPPYQSNRLQYLKTHGFKISQNKYHWKFIRNGSYYLPPYLDKPAVKNGINSYIYEEDC